MKNIAIVDSSTNVVNDLTKCFKNSTIYKIAAVYNNGEEALNYLIKNSLDIDLIIMDLLLPVMDGLTFLEKYREYYPKTKVIIASSYNDDRVVKECLKLGVSYFLVKPFNIDILARRIKNCFEIEDDNYDQNSIDLQICTLLHNLGIPSHIRGYKYIKEGIDFLYNAKKVTLITKDVYPYIASKYNTTPSRVERGIRHAIEVSCIRGDLNLMEDLFGFSISSDKAKPTNSEFLTTIAERLKLNKGSLNIKLQ